MITIEVEKNLSPNFQGGLNMLIVAIPDKLINRIYEFSGLFRQTPEEYIIELIEERIEHET